MIRHTNGSHEYLRKQCRLARWCLVLTQKRESGECKLLDDSLQSDQRIYCLLTNVGKSVGKSVGIKVGAKVLSGRNKRES